MLTISHPILLETPFQLEQLLLVTFTRAATRELRQRVRAALSIAHKVLAAAYLDKPLPTPPFDYLIPYIEGTKQELLLAKRRLEHALLCFDDAQIFTIHGFCARMLREYAISCQVSYQKCDKEPMGLTAAVLLPIIRDFFRCELSLDDFSIGQLKILLREYDGDINSLERALCKQLASAVPIYSQAPTFIESLKDMQEAMPLLMHQSGATSRGILEDFCSQAPYYKQLCDRRREPKPEIVARIEKFAALFDKKMWGGEELDGLLSDGLFYLEALSPHQRTSKTLPQKLALRHPLFAETLRYHLQSIVIEAATPSLLFARLAARCQQLIQRQLALKEQQNPDNLLRTMAAAVKNEKFASQLRARYRAAIIDEFQDTDPLQWQIFSSLFLPAPLTAAGQKPAAPAKKLTEQVNGAAAIWPGIFCLVGDPKQSIYAFRQADIYTYLAAAHALGSDQHATLEVNWRSHSALVHALNTLFAEETTPAFIALPRLQMALTYRAVKSSEERKERSFSDEKGAIHFFVAESEEQLDIEKERLFAFIAQEICQLHQKDGIALASFALLVADRFQGERLAAFLHKFGIATAAQRTALLAESSAAVAWVDLLRSLAYPSNESHWRCALGSSLIGWNSEQLKALEQQQQRAIAVAKWHSMRCYLQDNGFASFLEELLTSRWHGAENPDVATRLLMQEGEESFLADIMHIAELLIAWQYSESLPVEKLLHRLELFIQEDPYHGEAAVRRRADPAGDAVQIITSHASKGLEFDIVFAIGLIKQSPLPALLIPTPMEGEVKLIAVASREQQLYRNYCDELDAEKSRQLYVAMTRAKQRLYLPAVFAAKKGELERGRASPMELFTARIGRPPATFEELYQRIAAADASPLYSFIEKSQKEASITVTKLKEMNDLAAPNRLTYYCTLPKQASFCCELPQRKEDCIELIAPPLLSKAIPQSFLHSFTSLMHREGWEGRISALAHISHTPRECEKCGLATPPQEWRAHIKNVHTLPAGARTGDFLHSIFQNIPFSLVKGANAPAELFPWLERYVANSPFASWLEVVATLVLQAFHTTLHPREAPAFALADIPEQRSFREMPFLFACEGITSFTIPSEDMIQGIVDLFFEHNGKYYLVDWKSNWLGDSFESYNRQVIERAMVDNGYLLQAALYKEAMRRYLALIEPDRPFAECWGGIFYLFLRGLKASSPHSPGIAEYL